MSVEPNKTNPAPKLGEGEQGKRVKGKYVRRAVKQSNGKFRMQWVSKAKLAAKKPKPGSVVKPKPTPKPKPKPGAGKPQPKRQGFPDLGVYEGTGADYKSVNPAAVATVRGMNQPLWQQINEAKQLVNDNIKASNSMTAQTKQELERLAATARGGTQGLLGLAARQAVADNAGQQEASRFLGQAFGGAMNDQIRLLMQPTMNTQSTEANAENVRNAWGVGLSGSLQNDFFNRAQAIAATTQNSFNNNQRLQHQRQVDAIKKQIIANRQQLPALRRQYLQEDAQFGLARQQADMEAKAAEAAFNYKQGEDAADDAYREERDAVADAKAADKSLAAMSKENRERADNIYSAVQKMLTLAKTGTTTISTIGKDGKLEKVTTPNTIEKIFGKNGGPWRESFKRLTGPSMQMNVDEAAILATKWFPNSVNGKNYFNIKKMLDNRGVSVKAQREILGSTVRPVQGPPAPSKSPAKQVSELKKKAKSFNKQWKNKWFSNGGSLYRIIGVSAAGKNFLWMIEEKPKKGKGGRSLSFTTKPGKFPKVISNGTQVNQ